MSRIPEAMNMEFQTSLSVDQAVNNLRLAIQEPPLAIVDLRTKLHLAGEVGPERVVLYREHGRSTWYGQFEGRFTSEGKATYLTGRFVQKPGGFVDSGAGFLIVWAFVLAIVAVIRWPSHQEGGMVAAALVAGTVGASMLWYHSRNTRVEVRLLREEIAAKLKERGA